MRAVVPEEHEPAREDDREARRVAAVELAVVVDVRLDEHVDLRRQAGDEGVERGPVMEDLAARQVVAEGEVPVLVDRQVPGDLLEQTLSGEEEQQAGGDPPEYRERHGE